MTTDKIAMPCETETPPPPITSDVLEQHRLINRGQLKQIIPVSNMTIWRWEQAGLLPRHISIGGRNFWRLNGVLEMIQRIEEGESDA